MMLLPTRAVLARSMRINKYESILVPKVVVFAEFSRVLMAFSPYFPGRKNSFHRTKW
jgi:hypothetical protein